ncbi:MAG: hypothetical protein WC444_06035 [Candidatus Paceibacterota bacterium]
MKDDQTLKDFLYLPQWEQRIYSYTAAAFKDVLDDEGIPYFNAHLLPVVSMVKVLTDQPHVIQEAYGHDLVEDLHLTYSQLLEVFDERAVKLINELTHAGTKSTGYYFPNLKSRDAVMIKMCDRASNLSRMSAWPPSRQQSYIEASRFWKLFEDEPSLKSFTKQWKQKK